MHLLELSATFEADTMQKFAGFPSSWLELCQYTDSLLQNLIVCILSPLCEYSVTPWTQCFIRCVYQYNATQPTPVSQGKLVVSSGLPYSRICCNVALPLDAPAWKAWVRVKCERKFFMRLDMPTNTASIKVANVFTSSPTLPYPPSQKNFVLMSKIWDSIEAPDKARRSIFTQSIVNSFLDVIWPPHYKDVQLNTAWW